MKIEFKYFVAGHNPNIMDKFSGMTTGDTILWAKIRDEWIMCPEKSCLKTFKSIRNFLETDKIKTLEYEIYMLKKELDKK